MILPGMPAPTKEALLLSSSEAAWRKVRTISGLFSVAVALVLWFSHLGPTAADSLVSTELKSLKEQLRVQPTDEQTKQKIRQMDLEVRGNYFKKLSQSNTGVYLLLSGLVVFLVAAKKCGRNPDSNPEPRFLVLPDKAKLAWSARWSVGTVAASLGLVMLALGLTSGTGLGERGAPASDAGTSAKSVPNGPSAATDAELKSNWPRFRGPGGSGVSEQTNAPTNWDAKTGAGVAWKQPVPAPGFNSPIIWRDRFYFSGGDATKREVFCYECATGRLVWRQAVPSGPGKPAEIPETTGYAASSMATDGQRVYAIFATGDVAAFTMDGKAVWAKSFGPLKNPYGHATSLLTSRDRLIVLLDQGEAEDGKSKLYALDGRTGEVAWQTPRKVGSSWATPISFESAGQAQVVALAIPWAISYRLSDGVELWRVECLNGEVTPSPAFGDGLVFVPSPSEKLLAIRPDGHGDVTKTHVAWSTEENVPDVTSPVSNAGLVFTLTTSGVLTCFDDKDGKKLWEHDFEMECHSSPSIAAGHVYVFGQKGTAIIAEAGKQFKEVFRSEMPDAFHASPAFSDNLIIMRGTTNLWGIGTAPK
jgi:outer membrane protein assembly factor BamB